MAIRDFIVYKLICSQVLGACCGLRFDADVIATDANTVRVRVFRSGEGASPTDGWTQQGLKLRWYDHATS